MSVTDTWIKKIWCVHAMDRYSVLSYKSNNAQLATCYNVDEPSNTILAERSQARKVTHCVILFIYMKYPGQVNP